MKLVESFVASLSFDQVLAPYDLLGSMAHARALARCRILSAREARRILGGLERISREIAQGRFHPRLSDEDIHQALERRLIRLIGPVGGKLHTARSRNDQVALDLRLYLKEACGGILSALTACRRAIVSLAGKSKDVIMPGFTHLQHAQPILFAHHILAYGWMLKRDEERLRDLLKRVDVMPLGSAALAGTEFPIDRRFLARALGFSKISENSVDATSSRDFILEFLSCAAIGATHLSRLAEELVLWSSPEFSFVRLSKKYLTGSSIMPQKRNPDVAELVRAKSGRCVGNLVSLFVVMKGLPLAYSRDLQEDKPSLFSSAETYRQSLEMTRGMLSTLLLNPERMRRACREGFMAATDAADYLVQKGVPFRAAHGIVSRIVDHCAARSLSFEELPLAEWRKFHPAFGMDLFRHLSPESGVRRRKVLGGTSPQSVLRQIRLLK